MKGLFKIWKYAPFFPAARRVTVEALVDAFLIVHA